MTELRKFGEIYLRIHAAYFLAVPPFLSKVQFLDSDKEGKKQKKRYEEYFGVGEASKFYLYSIPEYSGSVMLEKFICPEDSKKNTQLTDSKKVKNAITSFFYMTDSE